MGEKRLIDVDEAKRRIIAFATVLHSEVLPVDTVMMLLTQIPAVDAVEVTRCRECKRSSYDEIFGNRWCNSHSGCRKVKDNDFCSYGDRKDGDGNG